MAAINMIRKQVYITSDQDRALKERASEQGKTEAEVLREALDRHLVHSGSRHPSLHRQPALEELLAMNDAIALKHRLPEGAPWRRDDLYESRENRWLGEQGPTT